MKSRRIKKSPEAAKRNLSLQKGPEAEKRRPGAQNEVLRRRKDPSRAVKRIQGERKGAQITFKSNLEAKKSEKRQV